MILCKLPIPRKLQVFLENVMKEFTSEIKEGDYIICQSGARSTNVCQWLEMQGLTITNVQVVLVVAEKKIRALNSILLIYSRNISCSGLPNSSRTLI